MNFYKKNLLLGTIFILLLLPIGTTEGLHINFANALEVSSYPSVLGFTLSQNPSLIEYVKYFFNIGMAIAGILAVLVIMFGGVYYLVSLGRGKFTDEGKNWVKAGIIGLLILISAYLIIYTINPNLTVLNLENLIPINPSLPASPPNPSQNPTTSSYEEIPMGTLTETLLARTMDCYGFDQSGNPVNGNQITTDNGQNITGPTYLDHDRADCLAQLIDGAQKKGQIIATLSDEITKLMNQCDCQKYGNCENHCNDDGKGCDQPGTCFGGETCTGACVGTSCQQTQGTSDCCPTGVKNKIEHGPINVPGGAGVGEACNLDTDCASGERCDQGTSKCVSLSPNGASCNHPTDCASGYCDPVTDTCADNGNKANGAACNNPTDCASGYCDPVTGTCASGNPCNPNVDCSNGGTCNLSTNTCVGGGSSWSCSSSSSTNCNQGVEKCDTSAGTCATICSGDQDCPHGDVCNPSTLLCGIRPDDSGNPAYPIGYRCYLDQNCINRDRCSPSNKCVNCLSDADCQRSETCNMSTNTCVSRGNTGGGTPCNPNTNCPGGQTCNTSTNKCVGGGNGGNGNCITQPVVKYKGLDEFRTNLTNISSLIEATVKINNQNVTIINIDGNEGVTTQKKWNDLNLIEQLMYFKEKITAIENTIKDVNDTCNLSTSTCTNTGWHCASNTDCVGDEDVLDKARNALAKCSEVVMEKSSVDMMQIQQGTDKNKKIINVVKDFIDPATQQTVDSSKYCNGFDYANSSCLQQCQNACPDSSQQALNCYKGCGTCDPTNSNYSTCLNTQSSCIKNCFNSRTCIFGTSGGTFQQCIASCQGDQGNCMNICNKEDPSKCSDEYNLCKSRCNNDSKCVLDNAGKCLINPQFFQQCGNLYNNLDCTTPSTNNGDCGNLKNCINNSYLCEYGSNENAGYPDCLKDYYNCYYDAPLYGLEPADCLSYIYDSEQYSSSFIYKSDTINNSGYEMCPNPYGTIYAGDNHTCLYYYPKTAKCPASSQCPQCPCDQLADPNDNTKPLTLNFSVPNQSIINSSGNVTNAGTEGYTTKQQQVSAYQMAGPQCGNFAYNGDPLTFYCRLNWEPQGVISGQYIQCQPNKGQPPDEIPVGQTVDDAKKWANALINNANKINQDIQGVIDQMTKTGNAYKTSPIQNYCECNAKFENSNPICKTGCQYSQWQIPILDANGNVTGWGPLQCACSFIPCNGSPCQQITDYLSQLWNDYRQLKLDFISFYTTMITEPRSDIVKELTYSRQQMNACSQKSTAFGGIIYRTFSCTMAQEHTTCLPKDEGCYGILNGLVQTPPVDSTDNWFCATPLI